MTRPLYEQVFPEDSKRFVDYYYTEKTKDNQIYVVEEDGAIRSMLHLNPYDVAVNGSVREVCYIVAVATQKEYRSRGYMGALLRQSLRDLYAAHQSFTFLMPAAEAIYTPYDFRTVYEYEQEVYCGQEMEGIDVSLLEPEQCAELADAANAALAKDCQIYAVRSEAYYERLRKEYESDGAHLMVCRRDGKIVGCLPSIPGETSYRHRIMVRIVDVKRMLMSVKVKSLTAVCFTVTDPVIEENNRCIVLTGTEFSGLTLMESDPKNSEGVIPIGELSAFLFGAMTVEELCTKEGVRMTERMKGELRKFLALDRIYLREIV